MNVPLLRKLLYCTNKYLVLCLFIFASNIAHAAELGSWAMLFNQTRLHSKWSLHSEIQFRSFDVQPNTEQLLIRLGMNYHFNSTTIFSAGYGRITNYLDDEKIIKSPTSIENRAWEQLILKNTTGRVLLEHRYRVEQRWIESNSITSYKNRIRYLLRTTIPITKKELTKNTVFTSFYNEIFIHINNTPFDRNRLYGAVGFQFSNALSAQAGCLLQTVGTKSKYYLQFGLNYNPDFRKTN